MSSAPRQDNFQFRLAQWLLDQLDSHGDLETVTQQISLLISQTQEESVNDLYKHIGKLMFEKASQTQRLENRVRLCAELCHSLSVARLKRSGLSPRVVLIHEHLFRLCVDSVKDPVESSDTVSPQDDNSISVEKASKLLFNLWNFQLLSLVQICEYIFRVMEGHKTSFGSNLSDSVVGVRFLLESCFPNYSHGPWKNEVDEFRAWIASNSSSTSIDNTIGASNSGRRGEPHVVTDDLNEETDIKYRSFSPSGHNSSDSTPDESLQGRIREMEQTDNGTGNNLGGPPPSPPISGSFTTTHSSRTQVPACFLTGPERSLSSPGDFARSSSKGAPSTGGTTQPTSSSSTSGVKKVATAPTKSSASKAPRTTSASTAVSSTPVATETTTPPIKQKKVNVHGLFQRGGIPPTTDSPTATARPVVSTRARPVSWGPTGHYHSPHEYNPYMYWGGHPPYQNPYMPPTHQQPYPGTLYPHSYSHPMQPPIAITTTSTQTPPREPSPPPSTTPPSPKVAVPPSKRTSIVVPMEIIQEKSERLVKENEEKEKASKQKKEDREIKDSSTNDDGFTVIPSRRTKKSRTREKNGS